MSKSLKNISLVAGATMASRVLGLVRETMTAAVFGTSALASAFTTAFQLPNLFRRLLAEGGMTAAFVPTLSEELERRHQEGAFKLINQVTTWLLLTTVLLTGTSMLLLAQGDAIAALGTAAGTEPDTVERWLLAARLAVILFPYLVFVCLAAAISSALQTFNRFLEPALSPIWLNISMIGSLLVGLWLMENEASIVTLYWFCGGVLLGGFLQMAVPAWALSRLGWRPALDLRWSEPVRAIARLMAPTVLGSSVYLINMVVSRFLGLSLNDAAVSILNYATRLMELPIGVFAVAVSTVVFPLISRYAAHGDFEQMGAAYRKGMRLILIINVPAAAGLAVLAEPIIRLIFEHGAFRPEDTRAMIPILGIFAAGLPFFSFVSLVLRAFYAHKDTVTPVKGAVLSFVVNLALSLALMGPLSTAGLAVASNAAVVVQACYLQVQLGRRGGQFRLARLWPDLARILIASGLMGGALLGGWFLWRQGVAPLFLHDVLALVVFIPAGLVIYGGAVWFLRVEGREDVRSLLQKLGTRFGRGAGRGA